MYASIIMNLLSLLWTSDKVLFGLIITSLAIFLVCALMAITFLVLIMIHYSNNQLIKNPLNKDNIAYLIIDACNIFSVSSHYPYAVILWLMIANVLLIICAITRVFTGKKSKLKESIKSSNSLSIIIVVMLFAGFSLLVFGICFYFFMKTKSEINASSGKIEAFNTYLLEHMYFTDKAVLAPLQNIPSSSIDIINNIEASLYAYLSKPSDQMRKDDYGKLFFTYNLYQHYSQMGLINNNLGNTLENTFNIANIFKYYIALNNLKSGTETFEDYYGVNNTSKDVNVRITKASREAEAGFNKTTRDAEKGFNKTTRDAELGFNKTTMDAEKGFNKTTRDAESGLNKTTRDAESGFNKTTRDAESGFNKTTREIDKGFNKTTREIESGFNKTTNALAPGFNQSTKEIEQGFNQSTKELTSGFNDITSGLINIRVKNLFSDVTFSEWNAANSLMSKYTFIKDYSNQYIKLIHNTNNGDYISQGVLLNAANYSATVCINASGMANSFSLDKGLNSFINMAVFIAIVTVLPFILIWILLTSNAATIMDISVKKEKYETVNNNIDDEGAKLSGLNNELENILEKIANAEKVQGGSNKNKNKNKNKKGGDQSDNYGRVREDFGPVKELRKELKYVEFATDLNSIVEKIVEIANTMKESMDVIMKTPPDYENDFTNKSNVQRVKNKTSDYMENALKIVKKIIDKFNIKAEITKENQDVIINTFTNNAKLTLDNSEKKLIIDKFTNIFELYNRLTVIKDLIKDKSIIITPVPMPLPMPLPTLAPTLAPMPSPKQESSLVSNSNDLQSFIKSYNDKYENKK